MELFSAKLIVYLCKIADQIGIALIGAMLSFFMAVARTKKDNGKVDWLEASMCSIVTIGIWSVLGDFEFSFCGYLVHEKATLGLGVFIGFYGTRYLFNLIDKIAQNRFNQNDEKGKETDDK